MTSIESQPPTVAATEPAPTQPEKRSQPRPSRKRPFPKKKNDGKHSDPPEKNKAAKFDRKKEGPTLFTFAILPFFELETLFTGAIRVGETVYRLMESRDSKMTSLFTEKQFIYVILLRAILRTIDVSTQSAVTILRNVSRLRDCMKSVLLPEPVCIYIESIGKVETAMSISVVPYIRDYDQMLRHDDFFDPATFLTPDELQSADYEWATNQDTILQVQRGLSRALKGTLQLRKVKDDIDGDEAFLTYSEFIRGTGELQCRSIQKLDANIAQLGACFGYRGFTQRTGTNFALVHEAQQVLPTSYLTTWVLKLMQTKS